MRGDSCKRYISSLGQDSEANKKGSPILHSEKIFSSAASFEAEMFEVYLACSIHALPSQTVPAFEPSKQVEHMEMCQKMFHGLPRLNESIEVFKRQEKLTIRKTFLDEGVLLFSIWKLHRNLP